jgi:hypothetical protein
MTVDESADKELFGVAQGIIGEEKAELASNKPEMDIKINVEDLDNSLSKPTEEVQNTVNQ